METTEGRIPVQFFTRPGCHLCEHAREILREFENSFPLHIEEINILREKKYFEKYKYTVPVVVIGEMPPLVSKISREAVYRQLQRLQDTRS